MTDSPDDKLAAVQASLEAIPVLAQLADTKQHEAVQSLLDNEGFRLFLGLMLGTRQALYAQLAMRPVANAADAARASVIQGQIQGIDLFRETMLESFMPVGKPTTQGA